MNKRVLATVLAVFTFLTFIQFPIFVSEATTVEFISSVHDLEKIRQNPQGNYKLTENIILTNSFIPIPDFSGILDGNGYSISNLSITANNNYPVVAFILNNSGDIKKLGFKNVSIAGIDAGKTNWAATIAATNKGNISECYVIGDITGAYRVGGIVAHNQGVIENCYSLVTVSAKVECGGIAAVAEAGSTITNCYTQGSMSSVVNNTGGIAAYAYDTTIIQSCAVLNSTITNGQNSNIARIVGRLNGSPTLKGNIASENVKVQNKVITTGLLTNNQGLTVIDTELSTRQPYTNILNWNFDATWCISTKYNRPTLRNVSESDYKYIRTVEELELLRSDSSASYILLNDIILQEPFTPIAEFHGDFNGDGHVIKGLNINASELQPQVAFVIENRGTIRNLGFEDVQITGLDSNKNMWAATIASKNYGVIRECYMKGQISSAYRSGGLVAHNYSVIEDCYTIASISAKVESGGIVAVAESGSAIRRCYVVPDVTSVVNNTGGVAAYAYESSVIEDNAVLTGTLTNGNSENIGRIVGRLNGVPTLLNNIASETVKVLNNTVSGSSNDKQGLSVSDNTLSSSLAYANTLGWDMQGVWIINTTAKRPILVKVPEKLNVQVIEINSENDLEQIRTNPTANFILNSDITLTTNFSPIEFFSGVFDGNGHIISNLTIEASDTNNQIAFIRHNSGTIKNLGFADAKITGISSDMNCWAAIIAATNSGTIQQCYATGAIIGGYRSAGIVAHNQGTVNNCYANVFVRGKAESAALVAVAEAGSTLCNSYALAQVHSLTNNTGGLVAYAYTGSTIENCIIISGAISNEGKTNIGRIVGRLKGTPTLINNFASFQVTVQNQQVNTDNTNDLNGGNVSAEQLLSKDFYTTILKWDFQEVWNYSLPNERPLLLNLQDIVYEYPKNYIWASSRDITFPLSEGISHRQLDFMDINGNTQKANIISVDLTIPGNEIIVGLKDDVIPPTDENGNYIRTVDSEGHDIIKGSVDVQAQTTKNKGRNVIAGVNGEFYTQDGPEGYMIKDGSKIINGVRVPGVDGKNYPFHGFLGITNEGAAIIGNYSNDWEREKSNLKQASGGQFWIVKDGQLQDFTEDIISNPNDPNYDDQTYYRHKDRHPRTAAGILEDGNVFFVVIDGRGANGSTGVYIEELGALMKELGAYQALNMDGGGSSTSVTLNNQSNTFEVKNTPINKVDGVSQEGALRDVFSSLLILAN